MTNTETLTNGTTVTIVTADRSDSVVREKRYASLGSGAVEVVIVITGAKTFRVSWAGSKGGRWASTGKSVTGEAAARRLADAKMAAMLEWLAAA